MNHRAALVALVAAVTLIPAAACRPASVRTVVEFGGETMGSTWSVKAIDAAGTLRGAEREAIDGSVRELLRQIDTLMSTWKPDSELSRFNRSTSLEPFAVSPDTYAVFRWAAALSAETDGAFDVTVAPLVDAWGFGAAGAESPVPPDAVTLARLREATGVGHLRLDPQGRWVRKLRPDVRCDFSALAPGYAADRIAELLERRGIREFLVDVGGEMVARGQNAAERAWQIAIERPDRSTGAALLERAGARPGGGFARVVPLADVAIATSGDYRNYREIDGRRLAHIVDPRTGHPIAHRLASATVVAQWAVRADALATALMVLGPDEGMALAQRLDVAALLLVRRPDGSFEERHSPRMAAMLEAP